MRTSFRAMTGLSSIRASKRFGRLVQLLPKSGTTVICNLLLDDAAHRFRRLVTSAPQAVLPSVYIGPKRAPTLWSDDLSAADQKPPCRRGSSLLERLCIGIRRSRHRVSAVCSQIALLDEREDDVRIGRQFIEEFACECVVIVVACLQV